MLDLLPSLTAMQTSTRRGNLVVFGDNLTVMAEIADSEFDLVYMDPPFNTGKPRRRTTTKMRRVPPDAGDRFGFGGNRYMTRVTGVREYSDSFDDYLAFLAPRLEEARRLLKDSGTLYLHLDYREAHRAKLLSDEIFGPECFLNEIIWAYDYGGRSKRRWPSKHDTILVYVRDPDLYFFDQDAIERIPYMAPGLVTPEKAARGKVPTDVWWHTIVSPTGSEKTGYPTQKPLGILRRIIQASSPPGGRVLDPFAGSGTTAAAARELGRGFVMIDSNPEAIEIMRRRLGSGVEFLEHSETTRLAESTQ